VQLPSGLERLTENCSDVEDMTFLPSWSLGICPPSFQLPLSIPEFQNKRHTQILFLVSNTHMIKLTNKDNLFIHNMSFKGIPHDEWGISSSKWPSDV
jgi:hypothetical protein